MCPVPGPSKKTVHLRIKKEANQARTLAHIRGLWGLFWGGALVGHDFTKKERF